VLLPYAGGLISLLVDLVPVLGQEEQQQQQGQPELLIPGTIDVHSNLLFFQRSISLVSS
jgi:hypothetical protein